MKTGVKTSYKNKKRQSTNTIQLLDCKNIAGQVLTYNSKNFHRLNKKLDLERTMSELGKSLPKNQLKKQKIEVKMPRMSKNH